MAGEHDDYLWDKSGERDAEVERLERVLGRYRYDPRRDDRGWLARRGRLRLVRGLLLAAGLLFGFGVWWFTLGRGWAVNGYEVAGIDGLARVGVGERLETDLERAVLRIARLGQVRIEPSSRVRVDDTGGEAHRLFLERGAVHATIFARPREFQIGTPAGLSVDLGCEYDLAVDEHGRSTMTVTTGRVAFEAAGRRIVVPAGATCEATQARGPNVPVRVDAAPELVEAVRAIEGAEQPAERDVAAVLAADVRDNSVTLWHLFVYAASPELRAKLFERLAKTYPLPDGADAAALRRGDEEQLEAWRKIVERDWGWL